MQSAKPPLRAKGRCRTSVRRRGWAVAAIYGTSKSPQSALSPTAPLTSKGSLFRCGARLLRSVVSTTGGNDRKRPPSGTGTCCASPSPEPFRGWDQRHQKKQPLWAAFFGAGDRTRTGTSKPTRDFKSLVSTIPPHRRVECYFTTDCRLRQAISALESGSRTWFPARRGGWPV